MRALVVHVTDEELAHRRSTGLDRWDEMWEGVLHMAPAPTLEHQRILDELIILLARRLSSTGRGILRSGINIFLGSGRSDYRIPDLSFVSAGREEIFQEDGVRGGAPDAVIEIRSPEDETYEKLPFFAAVGVREVVVVDRDTKRPELFRLAGKQYVAVQQDVEGWLRSDTMEVRLRVAAGPPPKLQIEDVRDRGTPAEL